ncbi:uncharacterized protein [Typha angustifolia]|uniref:uncharacterized protein n=1 Tax=Typha angustifolia TaxID=59011 RepID=UPI003C2FA370
MTSTACFVIVSRFDIPIYEAEVWVLHLRHGLKKKWAYEHQFILHAALDIVQDLAWTTSVMFLEAVERFNDLVHLFMLLQGALGEPGSRGVPKYIWI